MLNLTPRHEDLWVNGGAWSRIIPNLGTRWGDRSTSRSGAFTFGV